MPTKSDFVKQEFREETVRLVTEQGYTVAKVARNLGVEPSLLYKWKSKIQNWQAAGISNPQTVQEELRHLRKENKQLKLEREILKKAAAFFSCPFSPSLLSQFKVKYKHINWSSFQGTGQNQQPSA